jgi:hypothetical protein
MKRLDVTLAIWKWEGVVLVGGTSAQFAAWAKKYVDADVATGSGAAGHAYVEYGKPWILWVHSLKNVPAIAHEAMHVAAGVLEGRGLKYAADSEEAYTYTMEFILRAVLHATHWRLVR